jgi:hypothetical protein
MRITYFLICCLLSIECFSQDPGFINSALQKLPSRDGNPVIDKLGIRFKDSYNNYTRLMQESSWGFSTVAIKQNTVVLGNGVEIEKNDYFFMIKTIYDYSVATNTRATVKFITDSAGAVVKYQTPYDRAALKTPRTANGVTNSSSSKMEFCQYYIWTERKGKKTTSMNTLYDVLEDKELFIHEDLHK